MADLLLDLDALEVHDDADFQDDFEALLDRDARAARGDIEAEATAELTEAPVIAGGLRALLEASVTAWIKAKFDEKKHPRWPKNTPKAGQFMQVGERFIGADGKPYEITAFQAGKIYAHLATGKATDVKTISLDVTPGEGGMVPATHNLKAAPAQAYKMKGDKSHNADVAGTIVIDPFVKADHDPSIAPPAGYTVTPEQWQRFGKEDQERIHALIERFGTWTPGESKSLINSLAKQYDAATKQIVSEALSSQYGSSTGSTISLSSVFSGATSEAALQNAQVKYEKAKLLLEDTASALQWDLYHRVRAPDVCAFHWGGTSPTQQKSYHVNQGVPIMPAYSMSTGAFQTTGFGSNLTAVPLAIRHVQMHTHGGGVYTSYANEYEITTGHRMKLDDRALFVSQSSMSSEVKKYLQKMTPSADPASGAVLYEVKKAMADPNYELPLPPEPPGVKAVPVAGEKSYDMPPLDWVQQKGFDPFKIGYVGGNAEEATKPAHELNMKPGDMMEGLKGTRYLLIEDTDAPSGLRYVKVDPSTGLLVPSKSYALSGDQPFRKLDVNIDLPVKQVDAAGWKSWSQDEVDALKKAGPAAKAKTFAAGTIFMADGVPYKVTKPSSATGGNPVVVSLTHPSEKEFTVNSGFKTEPLAHDTNYVPPVAPPTPAPGPTEVPGEVDIATPWVPKDGELALITKKGNVTEKTKKLVVVKRDGDQVQFLWPDGTPFSGETAGGHIDNFAFLPPPKWGVDEVAVGDAFPHDGKKYVVSSILKDGTVRAKPSGGKVEKFEPDHPSLKQAWRADVWVQGEKAKVGDLPMGTLVHGGQGAKLRPYLKIAQTYSKTKLYNLETGETSIVTNAKSFTTLSAAPSSVPAAEDPKPQGPALKHALENLVPSSEKVNAGQFIEQGGGYWMPGNNSDPSEGLIHVYHEKARVYESGQDVGGELYADLPPGTVLQNAVGKQFVVAKQDPDTGYIPLKNPDGSEYTFAEAQEKVPGSGITVVSAPSVDVGWKMVFADHITGEPTGEPQNLTNPDGSINSLWAAAEGYPMVPKDQGDPQWGTSFDPSKWEKGSQTTVGDLPLGTLVSPPEYPDLHMVLHAHLDDGHVQLLNAKTGEIMGVPWMPNVIVHPWTPKADVAEPDHGQFHKGDAVKVSQLQAGDVFEQPEVHPGFMFKVITPSDAVMDAKVQVTAPDGSTFNYDKPPGTTVVFHAHAGDGPDLDATKNPPAQSVAPEMPADPHALPEHTAFDPYLHPKGGKKKNDKVGTMAPGTVFKDKSGTLYEVKDISQQDAVVISDGEKLLKLNGDLRGQVVTDQAQINAFHSNDKAGPWPAAGTPTLQDPPNVARIKAKLEPSNSQMQWAVEPGDYFQTDEGDVWKAKAKDASGFIEAESLFDGKVLWHEPTHPIVGIFKPSAETKHGPNDPSMGKAADASGWVLGDYAFNEQGHKLIAMPFSAVVMAGKASPSDAETKIALYDFDAVNLEVVDIGDLFDLSIPAAHGLQPGDSAKAYTVGLGAVDVQVVSGQTLGNGEPGVKVKLPNGNTEVLPPSAVTPLEAHTPDGGKVEKPDMTTAQWSKGELHPISKAGELEVGQFISVSISDDGKPQYMVTAKANGKTMISVLGTDTGEPFTYDDEEGIGGSWGKNLRLYRLKQPGDTSAAPPSGFTTAEKFGDLDVGDTYGWHMGEPNEYSFKVVAKGANGVTVQAEDGDTDTWPADKSFAQPPQVVKASPAGGGFQLGQDVGGEPYSGFAPGTILQTATEQKLIVGTAKPNGDIPLLMPDGSEFTYAKADELVPGNGITFVAAPSVATAPVGVPNSDSPSNVDMRPAGAGGASIMSTDAAKEAGFYHVIDGPKVAKADIEPFQLVQLPNGKVAYMGAMKDENDNFVPTGKIFELGSINPSTSKAQSFKLVQWNGPKFSGDQELAPTGPMVKLDEIPVGGFFNLPGGTTAGEWQVVGKLPGADGGIHAMNPHDGRVLHASSTYMGTMVTPLALSHTSNDDPAPSEIPEMPSDELEVGDTFHFQPDNPYPYEVTGSDNLGFTSSGMAGTPAEGVNSYYEHSHITKVFKVTKGGAATPTPSAANPNFEDVAPDSYFEDDGGNVWQKKGDSSAQLIRGSDPITYISGQPQSAAGFVGKPVKPLPDFVPDAPEGFEMWDEPNQVGDMAWKKGDQFISAGTGQGLAPGTILTALEDHLIPGGGGKFVDPNGTEATLFNGHKLLGVKPAAGPASEPKSYLPGGFFVGQHVTDADGDHVVVTGRSQLNNGQSVHVAWAHDWDDEKNDFTPGSGGPADAGWDIAKSKLDQLAPLPDQPNAAASAPQQNYAADASAQPWTSADPPTKGTKVQVGDLKAGDTFESEDGDGYFTVLKSYGEDDDQVDVQYHDSFGEEQWQSVLDRDSPVTVHSIGQGWGTPEDHGYTPATSSVPNAPTTVSQIYSGHWPTTGWSFRMKPGGPLFTVKRTLTDSGSLVAENPEVGEVHLNVSSNQPIYDATHPGWDSDVPF